MPRSFKETIVPMLFVFLLGALPAVGQQCKLEDMREAATAALSDKVSGTGTTWVDVFSRIIAQVDSLDLESGDTSTVLTWNIDNHLTAKASIVNAPEIFPALKKAVGDDADLLSQLSDQVTQGDAWQVAFDYNFQNESANLGTRAVAEKVATKMETTWVAAKNANEWPEVEGLLGRMSCAEVTRYYQGMMPAIALQAAEEKPKTLVLNAYFRSRDDLVGQDEMGASLKYTYGFKDGNAGDKSKTAEQRVELMKDAMLVGASNVAGFADHVVEARYGKPVIAAKKQVAAVSQKVVAAKQELATAKRALAAEGAKDEAKAKKQRALAQVDHDKAEQRFADVEVELASVNAALASAELQLAEGRLYFGERTADAVQSIKQARADLPAVLDQRLSVEAKWKQVDEYTFSSQLASPLSIPENESFTAELAWSFQFKRDGKDATDQPRLELSASYEDVDGYSARQSRLIAKLIASHKLEFMGENTELTAGLVYSNKPEYLAQQDLDEQLSANLGLTFKVGKVE